MGVFFKGVDLARGGFVNARLPCPNFEGQSRHKYYRYTEKQIYNTLGTMQLCSYLTTYTHIV